MLSLPVFLSRSYLYLCGLQNWLFCHVTLHTLWEYIVTLSDFPPSFCFFQYVFLTTWIQVRLILYSPMRMRRQYFTDLTHCFAHWVVISLETQRHYCIVLESGTAHVYFKLYLLIPCHEKLKTLFYQCFTCWAGYSFCFLLISWFLFPHFSPNFSFLHFPFLFLCNRDSHTSHPR